MKLRKEVRFVTDFVQQLRQCCKSDLLVQSQTHNLLKMSYNDRRNLELARALYHYTELFELYRTDFADRRTDA